MSHPWRGYTTEFNTNWIGGFLSILASVFTNAGFMMQKRSHAEKDSEIDSNRRGRKRSDSRTSSALNVGSRLWREGAISLAIGGILDFEALTFATQELVALVGGSSTVLIGAICSFMLKKQCPSLTDVLGFMALLLAVVCACEGSPPEHEIYALVELEKNFSESRFIFYSLFSFCFLGVMGFVAVKFEPDDDEGSDEGAHDTEEEDSAEKQIAGIASAIISGLLGSYAVLFAKCFGEILQNLYTGHGSGFYYIQTYLILLGLIGSVGGQLVMMNRALMIGSYITVLPTFQISWIIFSFASGVAFYRDHLEDSQITFLAMSLLLSIMGIYLLSKQTVRTPTLQERARWRMRRRSVNSTSLDTSPHHSKSSLSSSSFGRGGERPHEKPYGSFNDGEDDESAVLL
eukprot:g4143.t1